MALPSSRTRSFSFVLLLFISAVSTAAGGVIGVAYGRDADNLIAPPRVVELLKANGIGAASIYDDNEGVIQAFRDSGIRLTIALRNEQLENAARDANYAGTWVWEHVGRYFPATQIDAVKVGNEVTKQRPDLTQHLLPAMRNVYNAIKNLGFQDRIKVATPFSFDAVWPSFPPSQGRFRSELQPLIRQILEFLDGTGSYFSVNLYPYFAYRDNPNIDLDYFLGQSRTGVQDPVTKLMYYSLLDAQTDAAYSAMDALRRGAASTRNATVGASLQQGRRSRKDATCYECGCPSCSPARPRRNPAATAGGILNTSLAEERGCSIQNAQAYNSNLVRRIVSNKMGTPLFPDSELDVYIFSLFNENQKQGPASERSFGLFYPDGTKVYDVPWPSPGSGGSWCVANPAVGTVRMQAALDWACGPGRADCGPIQAGAPCYEPNTVEAHASWAMNSYYQRHGRAAGDCDFSGVGSVVNQRPRIGNCDLSSSALDSSWCVADPGVGTQRMQEALDWACGNGADCGPIQPGAQCYDPNTVEAHASWAVNSYYQKRGHAAGTCGFRGVGRIILQRPRYGNCELPG